MFLSLLLFPPLITCKQEKKSHAFSLELHSEKVAIHKTRKRALTWNQTLLDLEGELPSLYSSGEINFYCFSHPVYGIIYSSLN